MDIEYIKEKIYNLDEARKIQPGEYLAKEVVELLRQGNTNSRTACFSKTADISPSKNMCTFPSELTCSKCGKITIQNISKTHLFKYLQGAKEIMCDECAVQNKSKTEKYKSMAFLEKERRTREVIENTQKYIEDFLDPHKKWDKNTSAKERASLVIGHKGNIDHNAIAKHIRSLPYQDFVRTPYWVAISEYKKFKSNYQCALCGNMVGLATHHKTYERHGQEHEFNVINEDLIVLCESCHGKFHDKIPTSY